MMYHYMHSQYLQSAFHALQKKSSIILLTISFIFIHKKLLFLENFKWNIVKSLLHYKFTKKNIQNRKF